LAFAWRNSFGNEVATREWLRKVIMQLSLLEVLFDATKPSVVAWMLRITLKHLETLAPMFFSQGIRSKDGQL
jgi:hypothetical protein